MPGAILDTGKLTSFWKMSDYTEVNKLRNTYLKNIVSELYQMGYEIYLFFYLQHVHIVLRKFLSSWYALPKELFEGIRS